MDLNDAERYAVAALFTLALHSTHVETGVDKNGNSLSESDIAWGCPSEELFDEQLLSQVPLKLPPELLDVFWGFDSMAPAGLAPRLYAWLKIPRKAWPGLLRMPDLAGCAGSPEAVEAFVTLVRRYSAFLDPELDFTTGQASRLQQHFSLPAAIADAAGEQGEEGTPLEQQQQQTQPQEPDTAASKPASQSASDSSKADSALRPTTQADMAPASCKQPPADPSRSASMPSSEAVAAAAASLTAAAIAAEAGPDGHAAAAGSCTSATAGSTQAAPAQSTSSPPSATVAATAAAGGVEATPAQGAAGAQGEQVPSAAAASFNELAVAVDMLPKEADEGTVVPAATFTPAEHYKHTTSHKAVLALYELIGGCVASNTEEHMQPLFACAAQEAETAAFAAAAARGSKKALQKFKQHQQQKQQQQQQQQASAGSTLQPDQQSGSDATACDDASRPSGAWFPAADTAEDSQGQGAASDGESAAAAAGAGPSSKQKHQKEQQPQQHPQQQQMQGLASIQWYDARARVAVKRVAHWLRVPWPQVRAFEMMWSTQALSLDAAAAQPKYGSSSRAMQYLKVGAAAVGGGALLAVTGGLAAPAIAAGLGAAVTLAHGGAAVAAAVTGFAGSTAGTAAVTGLFGAWGASVSGGSAKTLYSDVTEFGFWDLSQSIYVDGKGPEQQVQEEDADAVEKDGAADADSNTGRAASQPAAGVDSATQPPNKQQQQVKEGASSKQAAAAAAPAVAAAGSASSCVSGEAQQEANPQQTGFLRRLFSKAPDAATTGATTSSSSSSQSAAPKAAATAAAATAATAAAAAAAAVAASRADTSLGSNPSSPGQQPQPPLQQLSPSAPQQQPAEQGLARKSPLNVLGWGGKAGQDDDEEGSAPRVRTKIIKLQDSAFNTDSDEDSEEFYDEYLTRQGSGQQGLNQQGSTAAVPQPKASSSTPTQQQQQGVPSLGGSPQPGKQQQGQQEAARCGSPELQTVVEQSQELTAVEVQDDPLSSREADLQACSPTSVQQNPQQQVQVSPVATAQPDGVTGTHNAKQEKEEQQQQPDAASNSNDELVLAAAAASAAAAGTAAAAAAAAAKEKASSSSGAAAGSKGGLSGLFSRKAPPAPVYVPLLMTPVNPRHMDETRIALTIAVNGCCIESVEDFVRPWKHLPSRDCDRFALVWESACLKELGRAVVSFLAQQALQQVAQKSIQAFLYTGLVGALALPMTLCTAMRVAFGSKWLVALRRAQAAGKMLAMQLAQGCHGGRPVTLIGCSMGARLVFHCLLELERLGLRGCVENVILLGAPLSCRPDRWCAARSVVAGRLINGYSVNDWTLGLLYRVHSSSSIWLQAAGMYKVEVPGIENINLSRLISGHQDYLEVMDDILEVINLHDA